MISIRSRCSGLGPRKKKTKQETGVVGRINGSADTDADTDTPGVVFVASSTDSCSDQLIFRDELLMLQKIASGFLIRLLLVSWTFDKLLRLGIIQMRENTL